MKVKNDFPKIDTVIRNLKDYVRYFEQKQSDLKSSTDERAKMLCDYSLKYVDSFIDAIQRYLDSVCNGDGRVEKVRLSTDDVSVIQDAIQQEDSMRTARHSDIIRLMILMDKACKRENLELVFGYAEEFLQGFGELIPTNIDEKRKMSERARVKRRELGNFGLYIAASVTAGLTMEDREIREFANCEGDIPAVDTDAFRRVKENSNGVKRNINIMLE